MSEKYAIDQWWVEELTNFWGDSSHAVTLDTRRAAEVAVNFVTDTLTSEVKSPREQVRAAAEILLNANGADLEEWSSGNLPPDIGDFLRPLAKGK